MKLKEFRKKQGITIQGMADRLGISKSYYEKLEQGKKRVNHTFLNQLVKEFPDIDLNWLIKNNSAPTDRSAASVESK